MNIFALYANSNKAARHQCDKHVVKMPTETFQMLGSALLRHGADASDMPLTKKGTPLKGGYPNHPSTRWAGDSFENFVWLAAHGLALCNEYSARYEGREHFCRKGIYQMMNLAMSDKVWLPHTGLQPFSIAISEDCECRAIKEFDNLHPVVQYRLYYKMDKAEMATWKRNRPEWFDKTIDQIIETKPNAYK